MRGDPSRRGPMFRLLAQITATATVTALGVLGVCLILDLTSCGSPRPLECRNNLKQLGLALHNYHDVWGSFPLAIVADESGTPMHSWRVLLLPYLDQQELYAKYRFDEPWDGPNNRKLQHELDDLYGAVFQCPTKRDGPRRSTTDYVAVLGPTTFWPDSQPRSLHDFGSSYAKTILLVELRDSNIHWMEPRDITLEELLQRLSSQGDGAEPLGHVVKAQWPWRADVIQVYALVGDGSVQSLPLPLNPDQLKALLSLDGPDSSSTAE